jgi:hypothetical protein
LWVGGVVVAVLKLCVVVRLVEGAAEAMEKLVRVARSARGVEDSSGLGSLEPGGVAI